MTSPNKHSAFKTIFHALKYPNFRLFFFGQSVSLVGSWIQQVAMSWLVYRLTDSPLMLGVVGFASQIPTFIFSPLAGILADRWDRRKILIFTQASSMVLSLALALLTFSGAIKVEYIIILGFLLGCAMAIDIPARHSFILNMVGNKKEALSNAIALNSLMFNSARLIGPAIAGVVIAFVGEGTCFLVNGLSFTAVIASLLVMKVDCATCGPKKTGVMRDLKEGFKYTFGFEPIRAVIVLLGLISLMGMSYVVLMPVLAKNVLGGGPGTLGLLMSSAGFGALLATFFLASRRTAVKIGYMLPAASGLFALAIMALAFSRSIWIAVPILAVSGFGFMTHMAASNIVLQTISDDDKRGRVMSFYSMAFMGMAPLGSLLAGVLASRVGAPNALLVGGFFCFIASISFARRVPGLKAKARHIYERAASPPIIAAGIATASELSVPPED